MATATWNRGRNARTPGEIPAKGLKDTLMRVKQETKDDHLSMISAAVAFYALLALVPALTSLVLMYAWFSDPEQITQQISQLPTVLPQEVRTILSDQLSSLAGRASGPLGFGAIFSLLFSIWSASKGSKALIEALNIIYDEEEKRGFLKLNTLAITLTLLGVVLSILAIGVIVGVPAIASGLNLPGIVQTGVTIGSWVILFAIFSLFLAIAYRFAPCRNWAQWKWVSRGSIISTILWVVASALFSWYAAKFGNFNKTYGSFGAIVALMLWFYITSFVVLLGGQINAELEHQTKKDTTKNPEKAMGNRNATMADTLGKSYKKEK